MFALACQYKRGQGSFYRSIYYQNKIGQMTHVTRLHKSQMPQRLHDILNSMVGSYITNVNATLSNGGLMNDGNYFYPLKGNKILYYNIFTKKAYILQVKMPINLKSEDVRSIRYLLHSDATEQGVKEFLDKWEDNYYKHNQGEGFPMKLLAYIPYGCYENSRSLVISTTEYMPMEQKGGGKKKEKDPYYFGKYVPINKEDTIEADQITFGRDYARQQRSNHDEPMVGLSEIYTQAIKQIL